MKHSLLKQHYDIVIVGSGMAGQSCAKSLSGSEKSVLLIDSNSRFYEKVCAGGLTRKDTLFIPPKYIYGDFRKTALSYKDMHYETNSNTIASFDRELFLQDGLEDLRKAENIDIHIPSNLTKVADKNSILLDKEREVTYTYLVGADGSTSIVRQYLGLPRKNAAIGMQYYTRGEVDRPFELILNREIGGYKWIFPHKNNASVGIGGMLSVHKPEELKKNLDKFVKKEGIAVEADSFRSGQILTDYCGYSFGNIFLAGDAAGATSGLTWEGIYSAILSGKMIGEEILWGKNDSETHWAFKLYLQEKSVRDGLSRLLLGRKRRRILFGIGIRALKVPFLRKAILKVGL